MLPDWLILSKFMPYGAKQPPYPDPLPYSEPLDPCKLCGKEMSYVVLGYRPDQTWRNAGWMHKECGERYDREQSKKMVEEWMARGNRGNLLPDDYRFWVGDPQYASAWSMCRCCREVLHSDYQRTAHFKDGHGKKDGPYLLNCSQKLRIAYSELLSKGRCMTCKEYTPHSKWGVPLCNATACRRGWMFGRDRSMALEMALKQVTTGSGGLKTTAST